MHRLKQIKEMFLSLEQLVERLYIDSTYQETLFPQKNWTWHPEENQAHFFFWGDMFKFQAYHQKELSYVYLNYMMYFEKEVIF